MIIYKPDPETGWEESWIELRGPIPDQLLKESVISQNSSLIPGSRAGDLRTALDQVHRIPRFSEAAFDPNLAAADPSVAAAWHGVQSKQPTLDLVSDRGRRASAGTPLARIDRHAPARTYARPLLLHFRRAFREQTGYAPCHYLTHQRLLRSGLLKASDATLDDIANRVGFSSAFHFSAMFKKTYGVAPSIWRRPATQTDPAR